MPTEPIRVFISHNHQDKTFVHRLGHDLAAEGVRPWIDDAEIEIGDSLITKIGAAIDEMHYFLIVLSPRSVASAWVKQELEQAMATQLESHQIKVLPILIEKCTIPGFLKGKMYADFTRSDSYDESFRRILKTLGIENSTGEGGTLYDPFAKNYGRHDFLFSRPATWHCVFCGWRCTESFNDYICKSCERIRPFAGGSATMITCHSCKQMSLAIASFCEWCGTAFGR